jgi:hypothetical protein
VCFAACRARRVCRGYGSGAAIARLAKKKTPRTPRSPGDYEAELVRLCQGNRTKANALIDAEMQRAPTMSRQGAALALVTRIRHERMPYTGKP